jgi:lactate dehydrogenase-like 2-hydroxyacid dehydrogenase
MSISRFTSILIAAVLALAVSTPVFAEFPERPIQVIVPYSAGGSTDLSMRLLADSFKRNVPGATMVIRNQPVFSNPNVIFTPHSGADTTESVERMGLMNVEDIDLVLNGEKSPRALNPEIYS